MCGHNQKIKRLNYCRVPPRLLIDYGMGMKHCIPVTIRLKCEYQLRSRSRDYYSIMTNMNTVNRTSHLLILHTSAHQWGTHLSLQNGPARMPSRNTMRQRCSLNLVAANSWSVTVRGDHNRSATGLARGHMRASRVRGLTCMGGMCV